MGFLGATDLPTRTVDDFRATLRDREAKLAVAKVQRDEVLDNIGRANAAVDAGDKLARNALPALNKARDVVSRLVLSVEREVAEAKKRVEMAQAQVDAVVLKRAQSDAAGVSADKWFECICPDGVPKVRHRAASLEALRRVLQPGYVAVGQVFGHAEDGTGGFVSVPGSPSMLKALLEAHGDELIAYLAERGIAGPVVILPNNNREMQ